MMLWNSQLKWLQTVLDNTKDNPNIENLLTILVTNINSGNVEFDATLNPNEDIQIIIGKDYQEFLNLNQWLQKHY